MVQLSHPYMTTGKTIALTRRTFIGKVMSLIFNMLSRLIMAFLPRSKCLLISWLQSPSAVILEPPQNKVWHRFHCFPIYFLHYFANKGPCSQGYGFSSGHVWMWELDCEESWVPKNWCFWTVVLEKTLESPLDCKEIPPVCLKGDQSWVFIGWTNAEAETLILWPPHAKSWLIGKDPDAGRDWGQEEKGMTEDEKAEWHHWLNGHEFR